MSQAYIVLETDDTITLSKKFRVASGQDYDDGTPNKAQTISRTIGGGTDVSTGEVYRTWSPTIMVRHTEDETGYGTLGELEQFYSFNNPNGTPSDRLTFIDHHGTSRTIIMTGELRKQTLGVSIEGSTAWYYVKIILQEVK